MAAVSVALLAGRVYQPTEAAADEAGVMRLTDEQVAALERLVARGLVRIEDDTLHLAPGALPYARTIAALFDPWRQQSVRRFSSAV